MKDQGQGPSESENAMGMDVVDMINGATLLVFWLGMLAWLLVFER